MDTLEEIVARYHVQIYCLGLVMVAYGNCMILSYVTRDVKPRRK